MKRRNYCKSFLDGAEEGDLLTVGLIAGTGSFGLETGLATPESGSELAAGEKKPDGAAAGLSALKLADIPRATPELINADMAR